MYVPDEKGILKLELVSFDSSGKIEIGNGYKTAFLDKDDLAKSIGPMKNVILKREGGKIVVEFKDDGDVAKFSHDPEGQIYYKNIKSGGKVTFDSLGQAVSGNFEITETGTYFFNGHFYDLPAGTKVDFDNGAVRLSLMKGGSFSYNKEGSEKKRVYSNVKSGGSFEIDSKGEFAKADFSVSSDTEVILKGYKYLLASDSRVVIDGNKVEITVPEGTKLNNPERTDESDSEAIFSFKSSNSGEVILPSGDRIEAKSGDTIVNFNENGFYVSFGDYSLKNSEGKADFLINTPIDTYLVFNADDIGDKKSYIAVIGQKLIVASLEGEGASVFLLPENDFGIKTSSDNTVSAQAKNGKVIFEKGSGDSGVIGGDIPVIKIIGESIVSPDKRSFFRENGEAYQRPEVFVKGGFSNGDSTPIVKISFVDNSENKIDTWDLYLNDKNQFAASNPADLKSPYKYLKIKEGVYVSSSLLFNQLSPEAQNFYDDMAPEDRAVFEKSLLNNMNNDPENPGSARPAGEEAFVTQWLLDYYIKEEFTPKIVFNEISLREFTAKTGIGVGGATNYMTPARIEALMKFINEVPPSVRSHIGNIYLGSGGGGMANGNGIHVSLTQLDDWRMEGSSGTGSWGTSIGTYFHESFHRQHFTLRGGSFDQEWNSVNKYAGTRLSRFSYGSNGFAWGYGTESYMEDIATFGDFIRYPEYWTSRISDSNPAADVYRAKLALLRKYDFMTPLQYKSIFRTAGLDYSKAAIDTYISAARRR